MNATCGEPEGFSPEAQATATPSYGAFRSSRQRSWRPAIPGSRSLSQYYRHQFIDVPPERPVILVNSRFSIVNPFRSSPEKARANVIRKFQLAPDGPIARHVHSWLDHAAETFVHFRAMVERLPQAFPYCEIVIRPHPSENAGVWHEIADRHKNCVCTSEGAAIDWILKSDMLVHNSCTTAVEAALLGVPALAYAPNYHQLYDFFPRICLAKSSGTKALSLLHWRRAAAALRAKFPSGQETHASHSQSASRDWVSAAPPKSFLTR